MTNLQKNLFWIGFWLMYFYIFADSLLIWYGNTPKSTTFFFIYRGICLLALTLIGYSTREETMD